MFKPINFKYKLLVDEKLKNGSRLTMYHFPDDINMFATFVNTGSRHEVFKDYTDRQKPGFKIINGLAHLIEHLIFSFDDNDTLNNSNIQEVVYKSNGTYNASTDDILTTYYFSCVSNTIIQNLKTFFNIFKRLKERFSETKIKTEIEAITNEQKKNFSFEFLNIYSIIQQLSDNLIFKHNTCGTYKSLDIENILLFIKLFYKTFYIPENFRFILIIDERKTNVEEIKKIFHEFGDFYHNDFINLMLQPLPTRLEDFPFSLNKKFVDEESNKLPKIKNGKIIKMYIGNNKNQIHIFSEFKNKDKALLYQDYEYIKFIIWLLNKKDDNSLIEILKYNFNIPEFNLSIYNYSSETFFLILVLKLTDENINQKQDSQILNTINDYLSTLKKLDTNQFKDLIEEYKINRYLNFVYSEEFSNYDINNIINNLVYVNLKLDFNCFDVLLNQYKIFNDFNVDYFKKLLETIDLNNCLFFYTLKNQTTSLTDKKKILKISEDFGYNINFYVNNNKHKIGNSDFTEKYKKYFILPENKKNNYKLLLNSTKGILNNCRHLSSINENKYIPHDSDDFKKTIINNIKIRYKTSQYSCFETSLILNLYFSFNVGENYNLKIINYLLIFEFIVYVVNKEYDILKTTNFIFDYGFNSFKNNKVIFYFSVLNDYFVIVFLRFMELFKNFKNQNETIKSKLKDNLNFLVEKLRNKLLKEIENNKMSDRHKSRSFYFNNYFDVYKIIDYLSEYEECQEIQNLQISDLNIFTIFPYLNNEESVTSFLNIIKLSTDNLVTKRERNVMQSNIIDFKQLNPKTNNKIIGFYSDHQIKTILTIPNDEYKSFKCIDNLSIIKQINPLSTLNKNYLLSVNVLINIGDVIKDDYLIFVIKEQLFKSFFNYFRIYKKYSYAVISKNDNLNQDTQTIKLMLIVDKNKINYKFIFNFYDEVKMFFNSQLKHYQTLTYTDLLNYQRLYVSFYNKKYNNTLTELFDYNKKIDKYKKQYSNNEIYQIINEVIVKDVIDFYINRFIKQPFNLFVYHEDG